MKKFKNSFFYIFILVFFSGIIYYILKLGKGIELGKVSNEVIVRHHYLQEFIASIKHNIFHPLAILLAQIVTIILVARFFGWICAGFVFGINAWQLASYSRLILKNLFISCW